MTKNYREWREKSDKEFDELVIVPEDKSIGAEGRAMTASEIYPPALKIIKSFISARDQALIKVLRECVPETPNEAPKDFWKWFDEMDIRVHADSAWRLWKIVEVYTISQTHASIDEFMK